MAIMKCNERCSIVNQNMSADAAGCTGWLTGQGLGGFRSEYIYSNSEPRLDSTQEKTYSTAAGMDAENADWCRSILVRALNIWYFPHLRS